MALFRKKPVVVEAYQTDAEIFIDTLEGRMRASPGDWIITGVKGECYPCRPDIFAATYEPVTDWAAWAKKASRKELMQAEWSSLSTPDQQKAADKELTRRGHLERYC